MLAHTIQEARQKKRKKKIIKGKVEHVYMKLTLNPQSELLSTVSKIIAAFRRHHTNKYKIIYHDQSTRVGQRVGF